MRRPRAVRQRPRSGRLQGFLRDRNPRERIPVLRQHGRAAGRATLAALNRFLRRLRIRSTVRVEAATGPDTRQRNCEEAVLLARVAAGDRDAALAALYDVYGRPVYRLGLLVLNDSGLAEDLVQETFVRLWRSAGRYDAARASVRTFVFTLARRAAVDLWRRRGGPLPASLGEPEQDDRAGGEAYEHLLLRLDVREALDALTPAHREVLELQYHEDLTQRQVAERLGVPLGTVKSRTLYALRALARELKERGVVD
jgi:RNA polymerase sigma-70 factor, ECF subfamily